MIHDSLLFIHYSSLITHHHHHHHSSRAQCPMTQCPQSHHIMDNGDTMTTVTGASPMTVPVCSGTQKDVESSRRPSRVSRVSQVVSSRNARMAPSTARAEHESQRAQEQARQGFQVCLCLRHVAKLVKRDDQTTLSVARTRS